MSNTRNLADLLDSGGDIKSSALDNVPATDISGKLNLTGGTLTGTLTMESTDAGSAAAPELILYRNSASPADGDYLGQVQFKGENDNGGSEIYAKVTGKITDASNGTEDGLIETAIKGNGSFTIVSRQKSDELQLLNGVNLNVDGNIVVGGTVDGVDIQTLNTTAGAALPKAGGTMTGTIAGFTSTGIDDNADATAMTITSDEKIGIGTASPACVAKGLHIQTSSAGTLPTLQADADDVIIEGSTPGITLMGATNGGGMLAFGDTGDADVGRIFYYHVDNNMSFTTNGSVWFDIRNDGNLVSQVGGGSSKTNITFKNGGVAKGSIVTSDYTNNTSYNTSSDYRLKENVVDMENATDRLKQLKPRRFNFIANADLTMDGFIAHEITPVVPEAVTGAKDAMRDEEYEVTPAVTDDDGNVTTEAVIGTRSVPDYQGIDQSKLVPLLVATIQELEARITALENA